MTGGLALYLFPVFPVIALLAGNGLVAIALSRRRLGLIALVLVSLLGCWTLARARYEARDTRTYPWLPQWRQVEMARLQNLVVAEGVAAMLAPLLQPNDTLFGSPRLAAALALDLHVRVAAALADLAPRWLQLGLISRKSMIERIEADHVRAFVTHSGGLDDDPAFHEYLARCYGPPTIFGRIQGTEGGGIPRVKVFLHTDGPCLAPR